MNDRLDDNVFNRRQAVDGPKFKLWTAAGLLLTYRCPARCACCYLGAGPDVPGTAMAEMSVTLALDCWQGLMRLAGASASVHITGGEPFLDYPRLIELLRAAQRQGMTGLEKIETNAYWCTDRDLVEQRLRELSELGLPKLQVSTDVYHQSWVPIERVRLLADVAAQLAQRQNGRLRVPDLQVRWRDFLAEPVSVIEKTAEERQRVFRETLSRRPERLWGRAAIELAPLLPGQPWDVLARQNCRRSFLGAKHVHIDGAANLFSGTCVGFIIGNIYKLPMDRLWATLDYETHPVISVLMRAGPVGLMILAQKHGFTPQTGYASKCHLCFDVCRFLRKRAVFAEHLGPAVSCAAANEC